MVVFVNLIYMLLLLMAAATYYCLLDLRLQATRLITHNTNLICDCLLCTLASWLPKNHPVATLVVQI